jgi:hypothetical protein
MDLSQTKLSKSEWGSVEVPVSEKEKRVIELILDGYADPNIRTNQHLSLLRTMKVETSEEMEYYLYKTYFADKIGEDEDGSAKNTHRKIKPPNKADQIRIQKLNATIESQRTAIFDFVLLDYTIAAKKGSVNALYTLLYLRKLTIPGINRFLLQFVDNYIANVDIASPETICEIFANASTYIEKNKMLTEYADESLYSHQRDLFTIFRTEPKPKKNVEPVPKCVLYMAPTGTGKTLSPIGLSQEYRVLFVCAARHVGLALAKSAISVGKRVAFAFGCETSSDIRLHYFAAADYTVNRKTGGIYRVDNSNGIRVEIMICDVASYLIAMYYMKSFHPVEKIITYWDEPTIGMDRCDDETAELHHLIHRVWSLNQIPNIVLSCATLPKRDEIGGALQDFRAKFMSETGEEPEIQVIESHDCKKTISLLGKDGKVVLPHLLFADYSTLIMDCVDHCDANRSLLRYFDVFEIIRFCTHVQSHLREEMHINRWFKSIESITLHSIKLYYLAILRELPSEQWNGIHQYMKKTMKSKFSCDSDVGQDIRKIKSESGISSGTSVSSVLSLPASNKIVRQTSFGTIPERGTNVGIGRLSGEKEVCRNNASFPPPSPSVHSAAVAPSPASGILLTTSDAHTLTDGPTIYLAEDIEKIGRFYIQQTKIPDTVFASIQQKIDRNNMILKRINGIEKDIEAKMGSSASKTDEKSSKKAEKEPASKEVQRMLEQINEMRAAIQTVHLNAMYIPNTKPHQEIWLPKSLSYSLPIKNAFVPNVDEEDVRNIMTLDVDNQQKLLLILGIGVFSRSTDSRYAEIMKRLAYEQRLFLIIASSDYIYGTNYQFCHGFIGKDLTNMTQQKTIQAIGRIGRNNIQQEYTVRFRDDSVAEMLFRKTTHNLEANIMNKLFCSDDSI